MLIVDCSDERRELMGRLFDTEGYEVYAVGDARRVMREVGRLKPDVVLLQTKMNEVSGFEICGDLRMMDEGRLLSILLVAEGGGREEDAVRGLLCGADDFIAEPQRLEELKARVRVQMRHRRDRELLRWTNMQRSRFKNEALMDPLTRVANRRAADAHLEEILRGNSPTMVMILDIDHFKSVNDEHGHMVGDDVLKRIATKLDTLARRGDFIARYGGEEFLLLLSDAPPQLAFTIAERFRRGLAAMEIPQIGGVTASIGVATWDGTGEPPEVDEAILAADDALYDAKESGRNCVVIRHLNQPGELNAITERSHDEFGPDFNTDLSELGPPEMQSDMATEPAL